jgi:hypothetical protein
MLRGEHPQITDEALKRHIDDLRATGFVIVERGTDPTNRVARPTIRLTVAGMDETNRIKIEAVRV